MVSKKVKKKSLLFLIGTNRNGIGKKGGYFRLGIGPKLASREGQKIPCNDTDRTARMCRAIHTKLLS